MKTKEKLARVLRAEGLSAMAALALRGYYDDFESESAFPIVQLVSDLTRAGRPDLAERARCGEWDSTKEEAEEWLSSLPADERAFLEKLGRLGS